MCILTASAFNWPRNYNRLINGTPYYRSTLSISNSISKVHFSTGSGCRPNSGPSTTHHSNSNQNQKTPNNLSRVKHIIAIASCKGGVGKSSVAVNLAYMMHNKFKQKVGILDADVYGPSLPFQIPIPIDVKSSSDSDHPKSTLNSNKFPNVEITSNNEIVPLNHEGVKLMSLGFLRPGEHAALRGPMVSAMVQQMLQCTLWNDLDFLFIDLPPGTGDIHLTVAQMSNSQMSSSGGSGTIDAAIVITTPQRLSLVDVEKGIRMFDSVQIPTISVVENMSSFQCPHCNKISSIYGHDIDNFLPAQNDVKSESGKSSEFQSNSPAKRMAENFGIDIFHSIPIDAKLAKPNHVFALDKDNKNRSSFTAIQSLASDIYMLAQEGKLTNSSSLGPTGSGGPKFKVEHDDNTNRIHLINNHKIIKNDNFDKSKSMSSMTNSMSIGSRDLRIRCRAADMYDEFTGKKLFRDIDIPQNVRPRKIENAGRYAIKIDWSDGHVSLFPYEKIEKIIIEG